MLSSSSVVGIDVSKASLDVAIGLDAPVRRFANEPKGHRALVKALAARTVSRVVLEATGAYESPVLRHLVEAQLPAIRVNPRQVRDFARATGILAKTDAIDARVLVRFGAAVKPEYRPLRARPPDMVLCRGRPLWVYHGSASGIRDLPSEPPPRTGNPPGIPPECPHAPSGAAALSVRPAPSHESAGKSRIVPVF